MCWCSANLWRYDNPHVESHITIWWSLFIQGQGDARLTCQYLEQAFVFKDSCTLHERKKAMWTKHSTCFWAWHIVHCRHTLLPPIGGRLQDYTKHQVEESWSLLSNFLLHWLLRTPRACCPRNANMKSSFHNSTRWLHDSSWTLKILLGGLERVPRSEILGLPSKCWN